MAYPASWNQEVDECAKIVNGNALWSWIYAVDAIFVEESDKNNSLIMIYVGKEEKMQKRTRLPGKIILSKNTKKMLLSTQKNILIK